MRCRVIPTSQAGSGPSAGRYPALPVQAETKTCWVTSSASAEEPKDLVAMPCTSPAQRS